MDNGQKRDGMDSLPLLSEQQVGDGLRSLDHLQQHMSEYKQMLSQDEQRSIIAALSVITHILPVWFK